MSTSKKITITVRVRGTASPEFTLGMKKILESMDDFVEGRIECDFWTIEAEAKDGHPTASN